MTCINMSISMKNHDWMNLSLDSYKAKCIALFLSWLSLLINWNDNWNELTKLFLQLALELMSRASCQVLEQRHHNRGPNTGSLAPGVRQRAKKKKTVETLTSQWNHCWFWLSLQKPRMQLLLNHKLAKFSTNYLKN